MDMVATSHQDPGRHQIPEIEEGERAVAPWFDVPYAEQLGRKEGMIRDVLGISTDSLVLPILPSPEIYGHRNKMEFSFGYDDDERPAIGFHQRRKFWRVADLTRSVFLKDAANGVYARIRDWANGSGLPFYRQTDNRGFFRHLVIREGKRTGEVMANLVVNPVGFEQQIGDVKESFRDTVIKDSAMASVWISTRRSVGDAAVGEKAELLAGAPVIHEKVLNLDLQISPTSFFQVNTCGTEVLYLTLQELIADMPDQGSMIDLFCGSGGIALALSNRFTNVWGIDADPESIRMARENASANGKTNLTFCCAKARKIGDVVPPGAGLVIVDPPRAGLSPKVARHLVRLGPKRLIYISCNPKSFREDMRTLGHRYRAERITPVDLFPHTPHVELIASLVNVGDGEETTHAELPGELVGVGK